MDLFLLQFNNVLLWDIKLFKLFDFFLFNLFEQSGLFIVKFFGLLIFDIFLLLALLRLLRFLYDLFLKFEGVLFEYFLPFLLQFLLEFSDFSLFANGCFKLSFFSSGLFFQHLLLLHLLLRTGEFQFCGSLGPDFSLLSLFFTSSSFIGFNSSLRSQNI